MNSDHLFRLVLLVWVLILAPIGFYFRLRSQSTGEKLDRRQEGLFILITLRAFGLATWLGVLAYLIDPAWMAWASVRLPGGLRWAGVAVGIVSLAMLTWTLRSLGRNLTDTVVTRKAHTLVTHGPYRWVRHPFYISAAMVVATVSLLAANWFLVATGGLVLLMLTIRTPREEERLIARFGDHYRAYMQRTGRFWPRYLVPR